MKIEEILQTTRAFQTKKGFLIIPFTNREIREISNIPMAVCDSCSKHNVELGYYIPVLNQWFCKECYDDWHNRATFYQEDRKFEERNFIDLIQYAK